MVKNIENVQPKEMDQVPDNLPYPEWEKLIRDRKIFGEPGTVEYSPDGEKIRCHLCGRFFKEINNKHLSSHGLALADDYKELLGLNHNQGLVSEVNFQARSDRGIRENTIAAVEKLRTYFEKGHNGFNRMSLQRRKAQAEQILNKRTENIIPDSKTSEQSEIRRTHRGSIKVFGKSYFISNLVEQVEIEVTDNEIIASGEYKDGKPFEKRFSRKDQH